MSNYKLIPKALKGKKGPTYDRSKRRWFNANGQQLVLGRGYWSEAAKKYTMYGSDGSVSKYTRLEWVNKQRKDKGLPPLNISTKKPWPTKEAFIKRVWHSENQNNAGYNEKKRLWFPHPSAEGGEPTIGPGIKLNGGPGKPSLKEANKGMTTRLLNDYLSNEYDESVSRISDWFGNSIDTISTPIKDGLLDLRHQLGSIGSFPKLKQNIQLGNLPGIKREASVTYTPEGSDTPVPDVRRNTYRIEHFWHY